jgi:hypothetical protein
VIVEVNRSDRLRAMKMGARNSSNGHSCGLTRPFNEDVVAQRSPESIGIGRRPQAACSERGTARLASGAANAMQSLGSGSG